MPTDFLTDDEYRTAYGLVPRLCVDLLIKSDHGILLTKRIQEPHVGTWHLPGGRVRKGESISKAARRIAVGELGARISIGSSVGFMEFLSDHGDLGEFHSVSVVVDCRLLQDHIPENAKWFTEIDDSTHPEHKPFLKEQVRNARA